MPNLLVLYLSVLFFIFSPQILLSKTLTISDNLIRLSQIKKDIDTIGNDEKTIKAIFQELSDLKTKSNECVGLSQSELDKINLSIDAIGEQVKGEAGELTKQRKLLQDQKTTIEKEINGCKFLVNESSNLTEKLAHHQKNLIKTQIFFKNNDFFTNILLFLPNINSVPVDLYDIFINKSNIQTLDTFHRIIVFFLFFSGIFLANWLIFLIKTKIKDKKIKESLLSIKNYLFILIPLCLITLASLTLLFNTNFAVAPLVTLLSLCCLYFVSYITIKAGMIYAGVEEERGIKIFKEIKNSIKLILFSFILFLFFNIFSVSGALPQYLSSSGSSFSVILFTLSILFFLLRKSTQLILVNNVSIYRTISFPVYLAIIIAELLGYSNFSIFLMKFILKTTVLLCLLIFVNAILKQFFIGLSSGEKDWQIRFRDTLDIKKGEYFTFLIWLQFLIIGTISIFLTLFYVYSLQFSENIKIKVKEFIFDGIHFAKIQISPLKIITGLLILLFLIGLIRWLKHNIENSLIKTDKIEHSEVDSIVTILSYVAYVIAFVIFLSLSGFDISNLALIGGALSVGIGFGLQNIVNNFVSGLILLFERPIKKGDWIVVNNTEGYVKRISVRSTVIETFDRCDVIVPNSELIANQVQNWMFDDRIGRVRINVGVAYGSDVNLVHDTLIEVAKNHPLTINDSTVSPPIVWFTDFADSSLNFQLLFYIKDIDKRLRTASEIRFAIDKAFREKNIQIPFPQRDIHIITDEVRKKGE